MKNLSTILEGKEANWEEQKQEGEKEKKTVGDRTKSYGSKRESINISIRYFQNLTGLKGLLQGVFFFFYNSRVGAFIYVDHQN